MADVMLGAPVTDAVAHFREAFHRYSSLTVTVPENRKRALTRLASRAMLLAAWHAKDQGSFLEAHQCLMRTHTQVCCAVGGQILC